MLIALVAFASPVEAAPTCWAHRAWTPDGEAEAGARVDGMEIEAAVGAFGIGREVAVDCGWLIADVQTGIALRPCDDVGPGSLRLDGCGVTVTPPAPTARTYKM